MTGARLFTNKDLHSPALRMHGARAIFVGQSAEIGYGTTGRIDWLGGTTFSFEYDATGFSSSIPLKRIGDFYMPECLKGL